MYKAFQPFFLLQRPPYMQEVGAKSELLIFQYKGRDIRASQKLKVRE